MLRARVEVSYFTVKDLNVAEDDYSPYVSKLLIQVITSKDAVRLLQNFVHDISFLSRFFLLFVNVCDVLSIVAANRFC